MKILLMVGGLMIGLFTSAQSAPTSAPASAPVPVSASASAPAAAAVSVDLNVRKDTHVELIYDKEHQFAVDLPGSPIIVNDEINLIPGEEFFVEADVVKDRLVHLRRVEKIVHPERTLQMSFTQNPDRDSPFMMLKISNPFKKNLKYRSRITPAGQTRFQETSNVGIRAELVTYESWPPAAIRLLLSDFQLMDSTEKLYTPGK